MVSSCISSQNVAPKYLRCFLDTWVLKFQARLLSADGWSQQRICDLMVDLNVLDPSQHQRWKNSESFNSKILNYLQLYSQLTCLLYLHNSWQLNNQKHSPLHLLALVQAYGCLRSQCVWQGVGFGKIGMKKNGEWLIFQDIPGNPLVNKLDINKNICKFLESDFQDQRIWLRRIFFIAAPRRSSFSNCIGLKLNLFYIRMTRVEMLLKRKTTPGVKNML